MNKPVEPLASDIPKQVNEGNQSEHKIKVPKIDAPKEM
jgi:hypothetical protein